MINRGDTIAVTILLAIGFTVTCSHKGPEPPQNVIDLTAPVIESWFVETPAVSTPDSEL